MEGTNRMMRAAGQLVKVFIWKWKTETTTDICVQLCGREVYGSLMPKQYDDSYENIFSAYHRYKTIDFT